MRQCEREGRFRGLSPRAIWLHAVLAVGTVLLMGRRLMGPVFDDGLLNPDSYMRLVRIERAWKEITESGSMV